ncbi:MAG: DUF5693 family protein [Halanaerobiaceae bacterium]
MEMSRNKIIFGLIIFSLLLSLYGLGRMVITENKNNTVELIMDEEGLREIEEYEEKRSAVLEKLRESGLTSVAIYAERLEDVIGRDKVDFIRGEDLARARTMTGEVEGIFSEFSFDRDSAFILTEDKAVAERLQQLAENLEVAEYEQGEDDSVVVYFPEWKDEYNDYGLSFDPELTDIVRKEDLRVVPRFDNTSSPGEEEEALTAEELPEADLTIFSGDEVTGYPSELNATAAALSQKGYKLGMIESFIAQQDGVSSLGELMNFNLVRVHSMQEDEMEKYDFSKIVNRYLRSARERNVRAFYLKPFTGEKEDFSEDELLALNTEYVQELSSDLEAEGYSTGKALPFDYFNTHPVVIVFLSLGVIAAGMYLGRQFKLDYRSILIPFALLSLLMEIVLIFMGRQLLLRQMLAFGTAVIFPSLAVIYFVLNKNINLGNSWIKRYFAAGGVSLAGGLLLASILADTGFIVRVYQFRGVKLVFLLPLLIISLYYFWEREDRLLLHSAAAEFLNREIKVKDILLAVLFLLGGIIYIGRTGNISILPVPPWEEIVRNFLEGVLVIRPRFKAFLLGHPFLVLCLYYRKWVYKFWFYPLLLLAGVGQITVLNTFSHLHTPLIVSIIRFIHGYWLGLVVGLILLAAAGYIGRKYHFPQEASDV